MSAKYFCVMRGLRGCYMPDSVFYVRCTTRRSLKELITEECEYAEKRPSLRAVASYAAEVWRRHLELSLPLVLATGPGYGLHISHATRGEYLEFVHSQDS